MRFLASLFVAVCYATFIFTSASNVPTTKPHVLFILIDDLGWNDLGFKDAEYSTPTIDALAYSGVTLDNYYVQPLCSPSRVALLSARYPYNIANAHVVIENGFNEYMPLNITTFPQVMQRAGYSTHAAGKWDAGMSTWSMVPTARGFDTFLGFYGSSQDHFLHVGLVSYKNEFGDTEYCSGLDLRNQTTVLNDQLGVYSTYLFTEELLRVINNYQDGDQPMFIYAAYQAMHTPLEVPLHYITETECNNIQVPRRREFCGMAKALDEGIFNLTKALEAKGILNETLIIFSTDNGGDTAWGSSNLPLRGNKQTLFEGGVRGTAFVSGYPLAENLKNTTSTQLMHITDWLPTLAELIGVDINDVVVDGVSQFNALFGNGTGNRTEILLQLDPPAIFGSEHYIGQAAYRLNNWKLILGQPNCTFNGNVNAPYEPFEDICPTGWVYINGSYVYPPANPSLVWLFDVIEDPNEYTNLADQYPEIVEQLRAKIEAYNSTHIAQQKAPFDPRAKPENFEPRAWTPWL